jgi:hypothetical protein
MWAVGHGRGSPGGIVIPGGGVGAVKKSIVVAVGLGIVALAIGMVVDYFDRGSIPHQAIQLHLRLVASSIYEFHKNTGRWPERAEDLAATSLPLQSPYWKQMLDRGTIVVMWPKDLQPDPKDNAGAVLTYDNGGLFARLGRVWVCWGDLRTEYVKEEELRSKLVAVSK